MCVKCEDIKKNLYTYFYSTELWFCNVQFYYFKTFDVWETMPARNSPKLSFYDRFFSALHTDINLFEKYIYNIIWGICVTTWVKWENK